MGPRHLWQPTEPMENSAANILIMHILTPPIPHRLLAATPPPSLLHRLPGCVGSPGVWFVLLVVVVVVSDVSADFLISAVLSALAGSVFLRLGCKF